MDQSNSNICFVLMYNY